MPNIASVLKDEITRLARKELRNETEGMKKASALYRSEIAALKRRVQTLEKQLTRFAKNGGAEKPADTASSPPENRHRFSAKGLRAMRKRLALSAPEFGTLLGVSAQTVYNWETETSRPREQQLGAIAALRGVGKREAMKRLGALAETAE